MMAAFVMEVWVSDNASHSSLVAPESILLKIHKIDPLYLIDQNLGRKFTRETRKN